MSLDDVTKEILKFSAEREWQQFHSPKNLAISVATEASELLEIFQWLSEVQSKALTPEQKAAAEDEIGDVLICLCNLSAQLGIDPIAAALQKMKKNAAKYPVEKARGKAAKYDQL